MKTAQAQVIPLRTGQIEGETLWQMMERLRWHEEGQEDVTDEEIKDLLGEIKNKADGYRHVDSKFKAEIQRLGEIIQEFQRQKKYVEASYERFKGRAVGILKEFDSPEVYGDMYTMKLRKSKAVEILATELTMADYLKISKSFPHCVKREYKWDRVEARKALESDTDGVLGEYCKIVENDNLAFGIKKTK